MGKVYLILIWNVWFKSICDDSLLIDTSAFNLGKKNEINYIVSSMLTAVTPKISDGNVGLLIILWIKKIKRFLSKSKGCRVVKSTTGPQCNLTRNMHGMVTRLTC